MLTVVRQIYSNRGSEWRYLPCYSICKKIVKVHKHQRHKPSSIEGRLIWLLGAIDVVAIVSMLRIRGYALQAGSQALFIECFASERAKERLNTAGLHRVIFLSLVLSYARKGSHVFEIGTC